MRSRRYRSASAPSNKSDAFFSKFNQEEANTPFFQPAQAEEKPEPISKLIGPVAAKTATSLSTWAQRLQTTQAIMNIRERLTALTLMVSEALGPGFTVLERTGLRSTNRNDCNFYAARSPDGTIVNFDANQQEPSKTYYCDNGDGQLTARVVLGMKALHPMGPAYTQMMNQQQQMLANGMEAKGWLQENPAPTNSEKLQTYLTNFNNFFFSMVSFEMKTCTPLIAFHFDGLFLAYKDAPEPERAAAFANINNFYDSQIKGNTGNMIRFKIWLQAVLNDAVLNPNYLALKINQLPGLKLTPGDNPKKHICP